jgi:4-amino-4-deoxy-L-arabinose transferase-like glycosyltransferase
MIAATPVWVIGGGLPWAELPEASGLRPEWLLSALYQLQHGERCFEFFSVARMALIPVSMLGTYLIWSIGRRFYGTASGWVAAILWCFSPTALAFGGTIAPDVSTAVFGLLAAYRFYIWLIRGDWSSSLWLGAATGIALLCKSTWIILPPVFALLWLVDRWHSRRWSLGKDVRQACVGALVAWLLVHAAYDFRGMLKPLGSFTFHSQALTQRSDRDADARNRFADSWLGAIPAPLPADYIQGIDIQRGDFESKYKSYFLGEWRDHGWWSYYVVGIVLKEPVAIWGLAALLAASALNGQQRRVRWREIVLLAPGVAVLALVSSQTGFNHHLRYVLPFLPGLYLFLSRGIAGGGKWNRRWAAACCVWYAASSAAILPRSYTFFTEAVGGASEGWRYLGNSNLDWGQDLLALRDWADSNPDKRPIWLLYAPATLDFRRLGVEADNGYPHVDAGLPVEAGWWAVFAGPMLEPEFKWFRNHSPTLQLSPSIKLIYVSTDDIRTIHGNDKQEPAR